MEQKRNVEKLFNEINEIKQLNKTLLYQIMENNGEQKQLTNKLIELQKKNRKGMLISIESLVADTLKIHEKPLVNRYALKNIKTINDFPPTENVHQKQMEEL